MKLTVTSISTCIWEAILSGARWQSLPDGDASWFPGSCQSKNREGLWTWTLVTGQWLTVNLLRWIRLSPDNHQTWETFLPSDRDQLRSLLSFLFRKHTTPATRRVGAPRTSFGLYKCLQYTIQCVHWSIHWDETDWAFSFAHPVFPTYFSLGRGLGCGVYLDAGSTRDPRTSLENFQMISKYRDATKFLIYQEYSILF